MTPQKRDKFITETLSFWRDQLRISPDLKIKLKYVTHREEDEGRNYAQISREMMPYGSCTMELTDEVFASKNFPKDADQTICHEILHLALHPLISYCNNMLNGNEGAQRHLEELEEAVITTLEGCLCKLAGRTENK